MARTSRRVPIVAATTALLMSAAACGGSSGPSVPEPEVSDITIAVPETVDAAPVFMADADEIFAEYGLNVEIVPLDGNGVKQLRDGDVNIALVDYAALFINQDARRAAGEDLDLRIVAEAYQAAPGVLGVVVPQDTAIVDPADLAGKRVAFDQENGLGWHSTMVALSAEAMGDPGITPVYMPFADMTEALRSGSVDAAWMREPFISLAEQGVDGANGMRRLLDTAAGPTADLPISGYAARTDWVTSRPNTIAAFQAAITKAKDTATNNRAAVKDVLVQQEQVDPQTATLISMGQYPTTLVPDRLQRVATLMGLDSLVVEVLTTLTPPASPPASG